ncbi:MAG TPA: hypothetical protein VMK32_08910 [Burkholderiaceae bacterium]|nr:hypothetical protein [Burkholderiaceae bacterium]
MAPAVDFSGAAMCVFRPFCPIVSVAVFYSLLAVALEPGGLYIAGDEFTFEQAAQRALSENVTGQRFFVLVLPPAARPLGREASGLAAALRNEVMTARGVLLVCQRDIASGAIDGAALVPGVVAVRGWPPPDFDTWPPDQLYYPGEDPARLPQPVEQLRRARAVCSP